MCARIKNVTSNGELTSGELNMAAEQQLLDHLSETPISATSPTPPINYSWFDITSTQGLNAFYFYEVSTQYQYVVCTITYLYLIIYVVCTRTYLYLIIELFIILYIYVNYKTKYSRQI